MTTKIAIKSDNITPFGGIFYAMDEFSRLGLNSVIDKSLGLRSSYAGYQYSEIISSLFWIYYCGGDHIEDIGKHLGKHLELRPDTEIPSPDTLLRGIKELAELDIHYTSQKGASYAFNKAEQLNSLMLDMLLQTEQLKPNTLYNLDFDHQFIPTESMTLSILTRKNVVISPARQLLVVTLLVWKIGPQTQMSVFVKRIRSNGLFVVWPIGEYS